MRKHILMAIGWTLVAIALLGPITVGIIAVLEGKDLPMNTTFHGRPTVFMPIAYVSIAIGVIVVAVIALWKKYVRKNSSANKASL